MLLLNFSNPWKHAKSSHGLKQGEKWIVETQNPARKIVVELPAISGDWSDLPSLSIAESPYSSL